jgi:hypothetical protein
MSESKDFPDFKDVCEFHGPQTAIITNVAERTATISADVKWLLRLGYAALAGAAVILVGIFGAVYPYFSNLTEKVFTIKEQGSVHARHLDSLEFSDRKSEEERKELRAAILELQRGEKRELTNSVNQLIVEMQRQIKRNNP